MGMKLLQALSQFYYKKWRTLTTRNNEYSLQEMASTDCKK